jgi:glycosyltransferase involved in cell wall biosynthesis
LRLALITHQVDFQDGQGRVNYELVRAALDRGDHVTVIAEYCSEDIATHPHGRFIDTNVSAFRTQLLRNLVFAFRSARWLRKHRSDFDLVQANGFVTWEPADVVAVHFVHTAWLQTPSFPFRWSSFSPYAYYQRILTIMNGYFERKTFRKARMIAAVSKFTAGEVAHLGISRDRIVVVPNGVDLEEFYPGVADRTGFNLPAGVPLALFVGDIKTTRKNLGSVFEAMQFIPEVHLAVAGKVDGSPYPTLAAQMKIADRVHFIGKTSKIAQLMRSCDLFVFPSRYEAHPLVLMEAMASGLPVVVSDNFGASDYIHEGGVVFKDANDVSALATAMKTLISNPERRRAMSEAARQQSLQMPWSQTAQGYLDIYDALLSKPAQRPGDAQ